MTKLAACSLFGLVALSVVSAQTPPAATLVVEGATLIDGNGGTPVPDSVVVVSGNKISAVGRKGQVTVPANARVIMRPASSCCPASGNRRPPTAGTSAKRC